MKLINTNLFLFGLWLLSSMACNPDRQLVRDEKDIKTYLKDNNLHAESTSTGLYYIIDVPGSSEHPSGSDSVRIAYTGLLLNGDQFDSSTSSLFLLDDLIQGMVEGIQLFGKGGEGTLFIPSGLGYGGISRPGIPANSVLIFEIKLIDF